MKNCKKKNHYRNCWIIETVVASLYRRSQKNMSKKSQPISTLLDIMVNEFTAIKAEDRKKAKKEFVQNECCDIRKLKGDYMKQE